MKDLTYSSKIIGFFQEKNTIRTRAPTITYTHEHQFQLRARAYEEIKRDPITEAHV